MILYDQNYNFIGISNETLSYLGYEDLSDFTSQHSDFANLLVNKEGYIYKFQNFSWIDFILYSGSPNKSALLKLKSGEELEIKLSVKEVHLTMPISNSEKYYAVRILSDNFVNIASKTDATIVEKSPLQNSFNLNSLMSADTSKESEAPVATPAIPESEPVAETESSDFVLNFPSSDEIKKTETPMESIDLREEETKEPLLSENHNDFSLNLGEPLLDTPMKEESFTPQEETTPLIDETTSGAFSLNFLKQEEEDEVEKPAMTTSTVKEEEDLSLNFLKTTTSIDEKEVEKPVAHLEADSEVSLNFLKTEESDTTTPDAGFKLKHIDEVEEPVDKEEEKVEEKISLNFLKEEEAVTPEEKNLDLAGELSLNTSTIFSQESSTEVSSEIEESYTSSLKKEQIIAQIKHDIDEIDGVDEKISTDIEEDSSVAFSDLNATLFNKNEVKKEKKSFTKTLKSLFSESNALEDIQDEESFIEVTPTPEAVLKKNDAVESSSPFDDFSALSSLGLDKEEEDDLLSEFVQDTKGNIQLFKSFLASNSLDQAEYLLIKMHSSADILNLNAIINTLTDIKQSCKEHATNNLETLIGRLEMQVGALESYLEREAV